MATQWTYAHLGPEQLALVDEAERTLDDDIVIVYEPSSWGTVDPETVAADGLRPVELEAGQLEYLQGLERQLGSVVVAYRREMH
jgi:hypothetical protein